MRVLDLACGAGGASRGYADQGHTVVGIDIWPQPRYPYEFHQCDIYDITPNYITANFDLIHAGPPCQDFSALRLNAERVAPPGEETMLIEHIRWLSSESKVPYIIENVPGSPLHNPITLCGSYFGLGVNYHNVWRQLRRHRRFECNLLTNPIDRMRAFGPCQHKGPTVGIYGKHVQLHIRGHAPRAEGLQLASEAMGIDWMIYDEITQAIPPAYTSHLAKVISPLVDRLAKV